MNNKKKRLNLINIFIILSTIFYILALIIVASKFSLCNGLFLLLPSILYFTSFTIYSIGNYKKGSSEYNMNMSIGVISLSWIIISQIILNIRFLKIYPEFICLLIFIIISYIFFYNNTGKNK